MSKPFTVRLPDDLMEWLNSLKRGNRNAIVVEAIRNLKEGTPAKIELVMLRSELKRLDDRLAEIEKLGGN